MIGLSDQLDMVALCLSTSNILVLNAAYEFNMTSQAMVNNDREQQGEFQNS